MAILEANKYLPQSRLLKDVFQVVLGKHPNIGLESREILIAFDSDQSRLKSAVSDIFTAAVAYFANRGHDASMQEMGTTFWELVNREKAMPAFTEDVRRASIALGMPPEIVRRFPPNEPQVILGGTITSGIPTGKAVVLLPPEYIISAQAKPIDTLSTMAWIGSQIRDMANNRLYIDPEKITPRACAFEAHFLREALVQDPTTEVTGYYNDLLEHVSENQFVALNYKQERHTPPPKNKKYL